MGFFTDDSASIETIPTFNPRQRRLFQPLSDFLTSKVGQGLPQFGGERVAPMSNLEGQGMNLLQGFLGQSFDPGLADLLRNAAQGVDPAQSEEFYRTNILPRQQRLHGEAQLAARDQFAATGNNRGSGIQQNISNMAQQFGEFTGGQLADFIQQDRQFALQAAPLAMAAQQQQQQFPLQQAQAAMQFGALPRQLEQSQLDADFAEFLRTTPELNPLIQQMFQLLNIGTQAAFMQSGDPSGLSQIVQGGSDLGRLAGIFGGLGF